MNGSFIKSLNNNQRGTTLVELLVSIIILAFVVGTFMSIYVYSTRTNIDTNELTDGTYVTQSCMEEVYALCKSSSVTSITDLNNSLVTNLYTATVSGTQYTYKKEVDGFFVVINISTDTYASISANMYKLVIDTYYDAAHTKSAAKMQNIITID